MTNLQAAVGCAQMERLDEFLAAKRRIRAAYAAAFADIQAIAPFPNPPGAESGCWLSGIVLDRDAGSVPALSAALKQRGIEARSFWKPVHLQAPFAAAPRAGTLAVSEDLWQRVITLPCSTNLSEAEQSRVVDAVKAFFRR
jgi:dTDP-4-amino-4,6-dideoxygalactose transaminase